MIMCQHKNSWDNTRKDIGEDTREYTTENTRENMRENTKENTFGAYLCPPGAIFGH